MFYNDGIHDDAPAIQAMLDECGIVTLDRPGTYFLSKTLIIRSNTRFILAPGVKLLMAPKSLCSLIENEHFKGGSRDENIGIVGGIFDGNCNEMGLDGEYEAIHREDHPYSPEMFRGKLIRFAHVDNITLEKMTVRDPVSYGIQIADVRGFAVRDMRFDYNCCFGTTDGVHINGPAYDGVIENLYGTTNDDMVSLTTVDENHAEVTVGEIVNVDIRNITAKNGYSGVRLLSAGNFDMRCIRISGVYGEYRHNAVLITHHNIRPNTKIWFDDIYVEHVHASKCKYPLPDHLFTYWEKDTIKKNHIVWIGSGIDAGTIVLRDISRHERADTHAALVKIDKGARIDRLVAENIYQRCDEGINAPAYVNEGNIAHLYEKNVEN